MKIVQVIHGFPPQNSAGSEVYTYNLSKELAKSHDVIVFYRTANSNEEEYKTTWGEYKGLTVFTINNNFKYYQGFTCTYQNDEIARLFGEFLDQTQPDIVHIGHLTCLSTTCILELKNRGIPSVLTLHDYWLICPKSQFITRSLNICHQPEKAKCAKCMAFQLHISDQSRETHQKCSHKPNRYFIFVQKFFLKCYRWYFDRFSFPIPRKALTEIENRQQHMQSICKKVDHFIAPSNFLMHKFLEFGIPTHKISYSDYGFDIDLFEKKVRIPSAKLRFGYIGTLIPTKGVHVLVKAFNTFKQNNVELKIYGEAVPYEGFPDYEKTLKTLSKHPQTKFLGKYENHQIGNILNSIDVLVVPSIWFENSPLTIHEATLAGLPVITSNIGGMKELSENLENCMTFKYNDAYDLFLKMHSFLDKTRYQDNPVTAKKQIKSMKQDALHIESIYKMLISH